MSLTDKQAEELVELQEAVSAALNNDWQQAHLIAQDSDHPLASWIHAVLHKIEGDASNSRSGMPGQANAMRTSATPPLN